MLQDLGTNGARLRQFEIANGDDGVVSGGWILFSNGAKRENNPYGPMLDPPLDPQQLARNRVRYYEIVLEHATTSFNQKKNQWMSAAEAAMRTQYALPPPCEANEAVKELKKLQAVVTARQKDLEKAHKELEDAKPVGQRQQEAMEVEMRRLNERFVASIKDITI